MDWNKVIHSGWRRVIGGALVLFGIILSLYYYLDMHFLNQSVVQSAQVVSPPSPRVSTQLVATSPHAVDSPPTTVSLPAESATALTTKSATSPSVQGKIKISIATQAELESLPYIGPKKAKDIIEYRSAHGFKSVNDLDKVKGIGPKTLEKLKPLIEL